MVLTPSKAFPIIQKSNFPERYRLTSGATFVEVPLPHLHRASIAVFFRMGSRYESAEENGISHFLEHMIFRGTRAKSSTFAVNLAVESLGATLFAATSPTTTEFELTLPSVNLEQGIVLLSEILTEPAFLDMNIERRIIIEEAIEDYDEFGVCIDWDFLTRRRLWPNHPLGRSVTGPLSNIESFTEADVRSHFEKSYIAQNAVVCVSGAYDPNRIRPIVQQAFSRLPTNGSASASWAPLLGPGPSLEHVKKKGTLTQTRLAFHAPGEDDKDACALSILLGVLDDGMSTLLHRRIFDERGLAYNVSAGLDSYGDAAALGIDAAASHDNVAEVVEQVLLLSEELKSKPPSDAEVEKAKHRAAWAMEQFLDDPQSMNAWYGEQSLFRIPPSLEERAATLFKVSGDDVMRVAKRIFTKSNLHLTTVGMLSSKSIRQIERSIAKFGSTDE
jgi:predicted Zn-dependent peptidase